MTLEEVETKGHHHRIAFDYPWYDDGSDLYRKKFFVWEKNNDTEDVAYTGYPTFITYSKMISSSGAYNRSSTIVGRFRNVSGLGSLFPGDTVRICMRCCDINVIEKYKCAHVPHIDRLRRDPLVNSPMIGICSFGRMLDSKRSNPDDSFHSHQGRSFERPPDCVYKGLVCSGCNRRGGWFVDIVHLRTDHMNLPNTVSDLLNPTRTCTMCMMSICGTFLKHIYVNRYDASKKGQCNDEAERTDDIDRPDSFRKLYVTDIIKPEDSYLKRIQNKPQNASYNFFSSNNETKDVLKMDYSNVFICSWTCADCRLPSPLFALYCITSVAGHFSQLVPDVLYYVSKLLCLLSYNERVESDKNDFAYNWHGLTKEEHGRIFISPSSIPYPDRFHFGYVHFNKKKKKVTSESEGGGEQDAI